MACDNERHCGVLVSFDPATSYTTVFGDGKISRRHRGRRVSEKGCRSLYSAIKKSRKGRNVEACVYREAFSGRIAAYYHNNERLFGSCKFTLVPHQSFRGHFEAKTMEELQVVRDICEERKDFRGVSQSGSSISSKSTARKCVEEGLRKVTQLTYVQAEDPTWFLLRAFAFTSRTAHGFLSTVFRNYENNLVGLSHVLKGRCLPFFPLQLPNDEGATGMLLRTKYDAVADALGMRKDSATDSQCLITTTVQQIKQLTDADVEGMTKSAICSILASVSQRVQLRSSKPILMEQLRSYRDDLNAGRIDAPSSNSEESVVESRTLFANFLTEVRKTSLQTWVMKPLTATRGMKEGSENEKYVLQALPAFISQQRTVLTQEDGGHFPSIYSSQFEINYLKEVGFVCNKKNQTLGDSPDGVCGLRDSTVNAYRYCAIEIKTMTSSSTIEKAKSIAEEHYSFMRIHGIGVHDASTTLFKQVVPNATYRAQCLHHAAILDTPYVIFIVAKGSRSTQGCILYAVLLDFSESLRNKYICTLDSIRIGAFNWVGSSASCIPHEYDDMLKESHTSDLNSFCAYYNISKALKAKIFENGSPLPPCRQLRPTALIFWNALKGGVDAFSRNLRTLDFSASKVSPVVSVVKRLLAAQVNNAGIIHRIVIALNDNTLPVKSEYDHEVQGGYVRVRQSVSQKETFGKYVRALAKELMQELSANSTSQSSPSQGTKHISTNTMQSNNQVRSMRKVSNLDRRFSSNVIASWNRSSFKALCKSNEHEMVIFKRTYCAGCSWHVQFFYKQKKHMKRGGRNISTWCYQCGQAICGECWDHWHSGRTLRKYTPSSQEVRSFEDSVRSKYDS